MYPEARNAFKWVKTGKIKHVSLELSIKVWRVALPAKKMTGKTIIAINITSDAGAGMRGLRFASILDNPGTMRWITQLHSPQGQMAEIAQFLAAETASARTSTDTARVVYMLAEDTGASASPAVAIVDTALVSSLVRAKGRRAALAGGLRCDRGHVMKFVDEHASGASTVSAYFAHVTKSEAATGGGVGGCRGGRCSDTHLLAQQLIQRNIERIVATRFRSCGECTEFAFNANARMRAELEVTERGERGPIRSDVVVYECDVRLVAFEVKHAHAAAPLSRIGIPYMEVDAAHVVSQFEANPTGIVHLKCENSAAPCKEIHAEAAPSVAPSTLSVELCSFLGVGAGTKLPRTVVLEMMCKYIKDNGLMKRRCVDFTQPRSSALRDLLLPMPGTPFATVTLLNLQTYLMCHYRRDRGDNGPNKCGKCGRTNARPVGIDWCSCNMKRGEHDEKDQAAWTIGLWWRSLVHALVQARPIAAGLGAALAEGPVARALARDREKRRELFAAFRPSIDAAIPGLHRRPLPRRSQPPAGNYVICSMHGSFAGACSYCSDPRTCRRVGTSCDGIGSATVDFVGPDAVGTIARAVRVWQRRRGVGALTIRIGLTLRMRVKRCNIAGQWGDALEFIVDGSELIGDESAEWIGDKKPSGLHMHAVRLVVKLLYKMTADVDFPRRESCAPPGINHAFTIRNNNQTPWSRYVETVGGRVTLLDERRLSNL